MSKLANIAISGALAIGLLVANGPVCAQDDSAPAQVSSQGGSSAPPPGISGQGREDDRTLEIAPQPGLQQPRPAVQEVPDERQFRQNDTSSVEPNFQPRSNGGDSSRPPHRPLLGITAKYTTMCYKGSEEHGLEVLTVDPNSPAQKAGLRPPTDATGTGAAAATIAGMVPIFGTLTQHLLEKNGDLGEGGDLIVAIDDRRVRSQEDLDYAMSQLKPGDTMYLTVIRPLPGGNHQTEKIAVTLGDSGVPVASNSDPYGSQAGTESYTH
ncbi:MAG TPA: PDZ domain-containing protein [Candidatus Binataceae bacterium]|nr:PDZ domain-containing protein [Candidatus Binataceae bacterium]